ncbi:MAG: hypothetical protein PHN56_07145 [Candidatus Nanoarchaeia archaeon]|nr:hypothetical protein [Candidatus Nanoarchaeia archaeon]
MTTNEIEEAFSDRGIKDMDFNEVTSEIEKIITKAEGASAKNGRFGSNSLSFGMAMDRLYALNDKCPIIGYEYIIETLSEEFEKNYKY